MGNGVRQLTHAVTWLHIDKCFALIYCGENCKSPQQDLVPVVACSYISCGTAVEIVDRYLLPRVHRCVNMQPSLIVSVKAATPPTFINQRGVTRLHEPPAQWDAFPRTAATWCANRMHLGKLDVCHCALKPCCWMSKCRLKSWPLPVRVHPALW